MTLNPLHSIQKNTGKACTIGQAASESSILCDFKWWHFKNGPCKDYKSHDPPPQCTNVCVKWDGGVDSHPAARLFISAAWTQRSFPAYKPCGATQTCSKVKKCIPVHHRLVLHAFRTQNACCATYVFSIITREHRCDQEAKDAPRDPPSKCLTFCGQAVTHPSFLNNFLNLS